ncbi:MAG: aminopeptidase [Lachnospiraceae bacterium]|nr:aminopeptidase [Lachnospiraceae bacterium]
MELVEQNVELLEERSALAMTRIAEIAKEGLGSNAKKGLVAAQAPEDEGAKECIAAAWAPEGEAALVEGLNAYFKAMAEFLLLVDDNKRFLAQGGLKTASLEELGKRNHALYEDVLPENYETSFGNPAYAAKQLGDYAKLLCYLHMELYAAIHYCYVGKLEDLVIREELFVEVFGAFAESLADEGKLPAAESIRKILYWFISDYSDMGKQNLIDQMVVPGASATIRVLKEADLTDLRYLYAYGQYISENELQIASFLIKQPEETIAKMADTYTEGYRIGFELAGKDLGKKKTAELIYPIGFERMMKRAVENFKKMGLDVVGRDQSWGYWYGSGTGYSTCPNLQYEFDHREDHALFVDKALHQRLGEVMRTGFEERKDEARGYAGPAVVETFGEKDFDPVFKPEAAKLTEEQNAAQVEYRSRMRQIQMEYIIEEERSFTIIAFPIPEIRDALPDPSEETYGKFFEEIIKINTLNYKTYQDIQATMIAALDKADYCEIKGMKGNCTDLRINLFKLTDPSRQTIFENCVADVNIPVGEVFTSPVLSGTQGVLNVSRVYLDGLEYRDLTIRFEDGMITEYNCSNFETEQENLDYIRDNILFKHKSLPIGEFAIGTNTTAYTVARKYGVQSKLPILIAEKTGPHFAVGDTCYSHNEEMKVYNPDGKEIVARDNEKSLLRTTDPSKAYFNCHTDITIPYDELGELTAVTKSGERIPIILEGRFVLPGTEELNQALDS